MKNNSFLESLWCAADGFKDAFESERNLRIHIVIAIMICAFAFTYGLDRASWAVLILTIFTVISAELINTAIEKAVDTATDIYNVTARIAKDSASAAVLVLSIGAIIVGVFLFGDIERITYTLRIIFTNAEFLIPYSLAGISGLITIFGIKR